MDQAHIRPFLSHTTITVGKMTTDFALGTIGYEGITELEKRDEDLLANEGLIIRDPEGNIDDNRIELEVYEKKPEATIEIEG